MSQSAFSALGNSVSINSNNGASQDVVLPGTGGDAIRVCNRGTAGVFIRWGAGSQTAVLTDLHLPPGNTEVFAMPAGTTDVAAITEAAGAAGLVYFQRGSGV